MKGTGQTDLFNLLGMEPDREPEMERIEYHWEGRKPRVILLDYVQTLVANGNDAVRKSLLASGQYHVWISKHEVFRPWLVKLLVETDADVLLVTARSERNRTLTLRRIEELAPELRRKLRGAYFNPGDMEAPEAKRRALHESIFKGWGSPQETAYMALESNRSTRAMYQREGIYAVPVTYSESGWTRLPTLP